MKINAFILIILFASCSTPAKLNKLMNKLPEASAKECSDRFPIKETIDTLIIKDTVLLNQYEAEYRYVTKILDSVLSENCDTVKIQEIKEVIKRIPAKPETKVIIRTLENTAKLKVITDSCQKLTSQLNAKIESQSKKIDTLSDNCNKYKKQRNRLYWWLVLLLIYIFRKPILTIIRKLIIKV